eukprot:6214303-Pleurochrysis_carterae.AAC.2
MAPEYAPCEAVPATHPLARSVLLAAALLFACSSKTAAGVRRAVEGALTFASLVLEMSWWVHTSRSALSCTFKDG